MSREVKDADGWRKGDRLVLSSSMSSFHSYLAGAPETPVCALQAPRVTDLWRLSEPAHLPPSFLRETRVLRNT